MLILVLLGMYSDAVVVFVTSQTLLFRLNLAILCVLSRAVSRSDQGFFCHSNPPVLAVVSRKSKDKRLNWRRSYICKSFFDELPKF